MPATEKSVLTVAELAVHLDTSETTVYALLQRGRIPFLRFGVRYVIPIKALEAFEDELGRLTAQRIYGKDLEEARNAANN